ncbi:hypothetical protein AB0M39_34255 [Streptomyces sp. NPDC051907]|uniref:hypothetical protein n=1 Tax=Streptomyces sp. NPDC051907 TaxID=3155284 RepID=UPI003426118F
MPVVFGSGRRLFAPGPLDQPILLGDPSQVVRGDRVTHLVYDVPELTPRSPEPGAQTADRRQRDPSGP